MSNTNYRKIWVDSFGPIPKDGEGRSYEIHHIDKNRSNNNIDNLTCISIQEHYNIHFAQGDFGACHLIARKMKMSPEILRELNSSAQKKRVLDGTHHLLSRDIQKKSNKDRIENGTHNWLNGEPTSKRERLKVQNGTHIFLGGRIQAETHRVRLENKTSHLLQNITCPHCNKTGRHAPMHRWHFAKCRNLASHVGVEPTLTGLEPVVLP